jgi:hypothetical protein
MAADYNVDRTNEFKALVDWRTQRLNMYHQEAIEQRKRDEWNKI